MWNLSKTTNDTQPDRMLYYTDGAALNSSHSAGSVNLMVTGVGYIAFEYIENPSESILVANGLSFRAPSNASFALKINNDSSFQLELIGSGAPQTGDLTPVAGITAEDLAIFQKMEYMGIIPYRNVPTGTPKSPAEIQALGDQYFPWNPSNFQMAYSIYDWTSADFIRFNLFTQMLYTGLPSSPPDIPSIASLIWKSYYPPYYQAENADFMNMFTMLPAQDESEVAAQLDPALANTLKQFANAEHNIFVQAVLDLPRIPVADYSLLYRGAMPMGVRPGLSITDRFGAQMLQFPGNAGPTSQPLQIPLTQAEIELFQPGHIFASKTCFSYSDSYQGALEWQNGIVMTIHPPEGYDYWPSGGIITPFSLNPETIELNFPRETRYRVNSTQWITVKGEPVLAIDATVLGRES